MKKIRIIALTFLLAFTLAFSATALGDDVDFGGDTGGGGGGNWSTNNNDSWGGGGTTGGWGNTGGVYAAESHSGFREGGGGIVPIGGGTIIVLILFAVIFMMYVQRQGKGGGMPTSGATRRIDVASLRALQQQDPKFSAADIEAKVKNWVLQFEIAWANGDMMPCRPFISDGLYNTYDMQLKMMRQNGEASRTEDLAVMQCSVEKWTKDGDKEYLDVWLQEKKRTYKVSLNNPQNVIKGDKETVFVLEYRWQLMRSAGGKSDNAGVKVMECPNCGAETSVNQSGKCEYCGSTLHTESFDWVLNKVDKLSQTSHK